MAETPTPAGKKGGAAGRRRCPICGKPEIAQFRPFCSQRCADLDLGRWLTGEYRIEADDEADFDEDFPGDDG